MTRYYLDVLDMDLHTAAGHIQFNIQLIDRPKDSYKVRNKHKSNL